MFVTSSCFTSVEVELSEELAELSELSELSVELSEEVELLELLEEFSELEELSELSVSLLHPQSEIVDSERIPASAKISNFFITICLSFVYKIVMSVIVPYTFVNHSGVDSSRRFSTVIFTFI